MQDITLVFRIVRDILRGLSAERSGQRCRFEHQVAIKAPRAVVWQMLKSRDITFPGFVPMRVTNEAMPGRPSVDLGRIVLGERELTLMTRTVDERAETALLMEILAEGTDPAIIMGSGDFMGFVLEDAPGGTVLNLTRELVPGRRMAALSVPLGLVSGGRRYKAKAEEMAREAMPDAVAQADTGSSGDAPAPINSSAGRASSFGLSRNGLLLGLAALASFSLLWGWQEALLVGAIIILHELGHALAMILAGIPVRGVYLVPFFGGAAIAAAPYRRESQLGFVALMGPGFSLLPTAALAFAALQTGDATLARAAELSGIINLLNLAPILPLDGGQVIKAALVSLNRTAAQIVGLVGAGVGFWVAWALWDPLLGLFVGLGLMITLQMKKATAREPTRWPLALGLLAALFVTIAAYAVILFFVYSLPRGL